jgi:hypothetical protein
MRNTDWFASQIELSGRLIKKQVVANETFRQEISNLDFLVGQSSKPSGFTWHFGRSDVFTWSEQTAR